MAKQRIQLYVRNLRLFNKGYKGLRERETKKRQRVQYFSTQASVT